jgi:hypothetical protein
MTLFMPKGLEFAGDFSCNKRCFGCYSLRGDGSEMSGAEARAHLR